MKRSIVIILLVAALVFVLAGIAATLFFGFGLGGGRIVLNRPLIYATTEETKTLNTDGPITLKVQDDAGDVNITGGEGDKVTVKIIKTGAATTQAGAERDLKNIKYEIKQNGDTISLTYELKNSSSDDVDTVDFIVTIPTKTTIDVTTGFGEVNVSDVTGDVNIIDDFGAVNVQNVEGELTVDTQSGQVDASSIRAGSRDIHLSSGFGKVSLENASGRNISLVSNSGALEMNEIRASGDIDMSTDFGNASFATGAASTLTLETKSGKVTLRQLDLKGLLTVKNDFGEVELDQVNASTYDLQTNSGSITVDGVKGKIKAHSGFGPVTLKNAENVTIALSTQSGSVDFEGSLGEGPHTIHSDFGEIILTIPADSALNVDLQTNFGTIRSDIPITVTLTGEAANNRQSGTMNEGGSELTVETGSGGISIQASQ